jgi:3-oxoacyl-[acyl-carrier protein] reductase/bacilysin biosynthesis oxidoreductase BacG
MDLGLRGKTALITGASQGIGLAIARGLVAEGVSVVLVARTRARLVRAAGELQTQNAGQSGAAVHSVTGDLGLASDIDRVVQAALGKLGRIDILINNAASNRIGPFFALSDDDLVQTWQVKALGYMRMVRAVAPDMIARREGCIVNIVGDAARTPTLDFIPGSMVNAALVNFTRGISRELARFNVRINAISPGWTITDEQADSLRREAAARQMDPSELLRQRARSIPLNRLVTADEIVTLTLLLVSDHLPSMTGEDIVIDGGATPSV